MRLSLLEVLAAAGGVHAAGPAAASVLTYHTDSREVQPGGLFLALRGAALDGHDFCADAAARGPAAVVVDREVRLPGVAVVRVADTWKAPYDLPGRGLARLPPRGAGSPGSHGKPS